MDPDAAMARILEVLRDKGNPNACADEIEGLITWLERQGYMPSDDLLQELGELDSRYLAYRVQLSTFLRSLVA